MKAKPRFLLPLASTVCAISAQTSWAIELNEKLCVLSAAEKAPNIAGIQIVGSSTNKMSKDDVSKSLIGKYNNLEAVVRSIDNKINFLDDSLSEDLKYQYSRGGPDAVRENARAKLSASIDGGVGVELQIRAAGQDVVFGYVCAWDALGRFVTSSKGAVR